MNISNEKVTMQDNNSLFSNTMRDLYKYFQVYTDTALAEKLGMKRTAIAQWRFKQTVPKRILVKYSVILSNEDIYSDEKPQTARDMSLIPVLGITDAGKGIDSVDGGFPPGYADEWLSRPQGLKDPNAYAVVIRSGAISMLPLLKPGMKLIASPNIECRSGDLAIIRLKNGDVTIKELKFSNEEVTLIAWNVDYEPSKLKVKKKDVEFCHPIIWFRTTH